MWSVVRRAASSRLDPLLNGTLENPNHQGLRNSQSPQTVYGEYLRSSTPRFGEEGPSGFPDPEVKEKEILSLQVLGSREEEIWVLRPVGRGGGKEPSFSEKGLAKKQTPEFSDPGVWV